MASEDTKDYILEFKIKSLDIQREVLKDHQKKLDEALERQIKSFKVTRCVLIIYTSLVAYHLGVSLGWWGL